MEKEPATSNDGPSSHPQGMMSQASPGVEMINAINGNVNPSDYGYPETPEGIDLIPDDPMFANLGYLKDDAEVVGEALIRGDYLMIKVEDLDLMSPQGQRVITELLPVWLQEFARKNADYNSKDGFNTAELLAEKGQFAELWRKMGKLKVALWDGQAMNFEGEEEILRDMIGHCFLALDFLEEK